MILDWTLGGVGVNALALKLRALEIAAGVLRTPSGSKMLVESARAVVEQALAVDDFDGAGRLLRIAQAAANSKSKPLVGSVQVRAKEIEAMSKDFEAMKKSSDVLVKNPKDAEPTSWRASMPALSKVNGPPGCPCSRKGAMPNSSCLLPRTSQRRERLWNG